MARSFWCGMELDDLPDEARSALANGIEWEDDRDSASDGTEYLFYCDDCDRVHRAWSVVKVMIHDGKVYDALYTIDSDGDWDFSDEVEWGQPIPTWWTNDPEEQKRIERDYLKSVAQTGNDYLGLVSLPGITKARETWQFCIESDTIFGMRLLACRKDARGERLYRENIPDYVRAFFEANERGVIDNEAIPDFAMLVQLAERAPGFIRWQRTRTSGYRMGLIEIDAPMSSATYLREVKRAARLALKG